MAISKLSAIICLSFSRRRESRGNKGTGFRISMSRRQVRNDRGKRRCEMRKNVFALKGALIFFVIALFSTAFAAEKPEIFVQMRVCGVI